MACTASTSTPPRSASSESKYDADFDARNMTITYGHPKDSQWHLKQFVPGMVTDQHSTLLFLQTLSGNESIRRHC